MVPALFANALPNALDSTVIHSQSADSPIGEYDTFIVTGDIDAMWQRDSTNQAKPYLRFLKEQVRLMLTSCSPHPHLILT